MNPSIRLFAALVPTLSISEAKLLKELIMNPGSNDQSVRSNVPFKLSMAKVPKVPMSEINPSTSAADISPIPDKKFATLSNVSPRPVASIIVSRRLFRASRPTPPTSFAKDTMLSRVSPRPTASAIESTRSIKALIGAKAISRILSFIFPKPRDTLSKSNVARPIRRVAMPPRVPRIGLAAAARPTKIAIIPEAKITPPNTAIAPNTFRRSLPPSVLEKSITDLTIFEIPSAI